MATIIPLKNFGAGGVSNNLNLGDRTITPLGGGVPKTLTVKQSEYETLLTPKQKIENATNFLNIDEDDNFATKGLKFLGKFVVAPFKPLAQNIMEIHAVNEVAKGVMEGKYDPKIFDEFESLSKTNLQVVGDVAMAVVSATPLKSLSALKGLPILSKAAAKIGAKVGLGTGAAYGAAEALSTEKDITPAELAVRTITGGAAGLVGGAVLTPLIRLPGVGIKKLTTGTGVKPSVVEKMFPSMYKKRVLKEGLISPDDIIDPPKLNIVERMLKPLTPLRVTLSKDPQASYIGLTIRNASRQTDRVYKGLFGKNWRNIKNLTKAEASQVVGLQEAGTKIETVTNSRLQGGLKSMRAMEDTSRKLAELAGIDTKKWRFSTQNHFSHLWTGKQVIRDKTTNKILAFAEDRTDGIQKLLDFQQKNPTSKLVLSPRTELFGGTVPTTKLSQQGYFKFLREVATLMDSSVDDVMEEVSMKGIASISPKKTPIGAIKFRKGELGDYTTDPTKVYPSLWYKLTKRIYLDPAIRKTSLRLSKIKDGEIRKAASDLIDAVDNKFIHQAIPKRVTAFVTSAQAQLKLGARISPPLVNTFQRLYAAALTGTKNLAKGQANVATKKGQAILDNVGVFADIPLYETVGVKKAASWFNPLYLFGKSEGGKYVGNRQATALAGYYKAAELPFKQIQKNLKDIGIPTFKNQEEFQLQYARSLVDATQFRYDISDFPPLLRSNLGKMLLQFKTYGLNMLNNTARVIVGKPLPGMEIFYPKGLTKGQQYQQALMHFGVLFSQGGIKALSFGAERALPVGVITWLALKAPALMFGVTAAAGVDISSSSTVELANLTSILPLEDAKKIWEAVNTKNPKALLQTYPAAYRIYRAMEALQNEGNLKHFKTEKNIMQLSTTEVALYGLGINPLNVSQESAIHYYQYKTDMTHDEMISKATRDVVSSLERGDFEYAINVMQNLAKEGLSLDIGQLSRYYKDKNLPRLIRDFTNTRKEDKPKLFEFISEFYKK